MPPISVLLKPASGSCNMHCDYCFYKDEASKRDVPFYGTMSEDTLKNVIRRTLPRAEGTASYAFQGGEPTLRGLDFYQKVLEYQKQYNKNHVRIHNAIQTNGVLLDDAWCSFFHDNHFLVGLSVDGIQETHEKYRHLPDGASSYASITRAAELLRKHDVDFNILTVVTKEVASHIEEIWEYYLAQDWYWHQYIPCMDPLGADEHSSEYSLTPEQYGLFLIKLFDLWNQSLHTSFPVSIRTIDNWLDILLGFLPEACDQCGMCSIQYVVEADGSVFPCDFYMMDPYLLGNFNRDRLDAIDAKRDQIGFVSGSRNDLVQCKRCPYHYLCRGGCRRNRELPDGSLDLYRFCSSMKIFFDARLPELKQIAKDVQDAGRN
ncbi:MAG: anaerobic sulfatase maturase [Oscillospiraceae bacterium]|nr:anaerobic sulfatase maturase [Oscillospiraceae bacterium]